MQFLIVQIFLLLFASFLIGVCLGWVQWRRGKAGITSKKWKDAQSELKRLRRTLAEEPEYEEIAMLRGKVNELEDENRAIRAENESTTELPSLDLRSSSSIRTNDDLTPAGVGGGSVAIDSDVRTEVDLDATKTTVREKDAVIARLRGELDAARQNDDELEELRRRVNASGDKDAEIEDLKQKLTAVRSLINGDD